MPYDGALLWDLDGTLVRTAKGGRIALREAVLELCGVEVDYGDLVTSGLTDSAVHATALRAAGIDPDPDLVSRISTEYVRRLPGALLQREGGTLPGVREALAGLEASGRILSLLLTGNTEGGARAKLERYGLEGYFQHGGGFCEGDVERAPIARRALAQALEQLHEPSSNHVVVIGDTPNDVACATDVGLRTIGVTTGTHTATELRNAGAWLVLERVPAPTELERLVLHADPNRR